MKRIKVFATPSFFDFTVGIFDGVRRKFLRGGFSFSDIWGSFAFGVRCL